MEAVNITFNSTEPKYAQIQAYIANKVRSHEWHAGDKLPSEDALVQSLDVSRGTIRKAIEGLIEEGVIERIHGIGTFVKAEKITYPFAQELVSFEEAMNRRGLAFETEVLAVKQMTPTPRLKEQLNIDDEDVLAITRVRRVDGKPIIVLYNWVVLSRCPGLEDVDLSRIGLFKAIEEAIGEKIKYGRRQFSAVNVDAALSSLMALPVGTAVLKLEQVTYKHDGQALEASDVYLDSSEYQIESTLYR